MHSPRLDTIREVSVVLTVVMGSRPIDLKQPSRVSSTALFLLLKLRSSTNCNVTYSTS